MRKNSRKLYEAYCKQCGKYRGLRTKNHIDKLCNACACKIANSASQQSRKRKQCLLKDCNKPHFGKGYCNKHYEQNRRPSSIGTKKSCESCGAPFIKRSGAQKYCNDACSRRAFVHKNKEKVKESRRKYLKNNQDKVKDRIKKWRQSNRDKLLEYRNKLNVKIASHLRSRVSRAVKRSLRGGSAVRDLGCSIEDLKEHLESKFKPGMSWDNYGIKGWHIDHIKPLSSFDLSNPVEFKKACHYSNLQPLWAKENISKGAR
jgi:uncharacterized Zn finger protein (UPF0148 family)